MLGCILVASRMGSPVTVDGVLHRGSRAISTGCMSVGNPGKGAVVTSTPKSGPDTCTDNVTGPSAPVMAWDDASPPRAGASLAVTPVPLGDATP